MTYGSGDGSADRQREERRLRSAARAESLHQRGYIASSAGADPLRPAQVRLALGDTPDEMAIKMSGGVPGALRVVESLLRAGFIHSVLCLDAAQVYGGDLWTLYEDVFRGDLEQLAEAAPGLLLLTPGALAADLAEARQRRPEALRAALTEFYAQSAPTQERVEVPRAFRAWVLERDDWHTMQEIERRIALGEGTVRDAVALLRRGVERKEVLLSSCSSLEEVFAEMNGHGPTMRHPEGYVGRSLSVGDVVWDPEGRGWLCAGCGWRALDGLRLPDKGFQAVAVVPDPDAVVKAPTLAECAAGAIEVLEREADSLQAMTAGAWARRRGLPPFDYAGLVDDGVAVAVLEDDAFHTLLGEAVDLGGHGRSQPGPVLHEMRATTEWTDVRQVTIVRSGRDALARRTLRPAGRELLVVLNGPVDVERLADVQALVSDLLTDSQRFRSRGGGRLVDDLPLPVVVAVPANSADEAAERRRLLAMLEVMDPRVRVAQEHPRGADWMEELRRTRGIRAELTEKGVRL